MNENKQWPEDQADWPHAVGVVQGGVVPAKPTHTYGKTRAVTQEPFGYFRAQRFWWTNCNKNDEGAVPLYSQETVNALQERCDELLKQRDELLTALESVGHKHGCHKNAFGDKCTCGIGAVIAKVKGGAA